MAKRSLKQIEEGLRRKFAEADNMPTAMDYLDNLGKNSPHRGDPIISPDLGGGQGPGGAGRVTIKPDTRVTAGARARDRAEAEKIRAQQQQLQQQNKEVKVEPKPEPPKPAEPQPKTPKEKTPKSQEPALQSPKTEPQKPEGEKLSRKDQKNLDRYGTTDKAEIIKLQNIEANTKKIERDTPISPVAKTAVATGVATGVGAGAAGGYYAYKNPEEVGAALGTETGDTPTSVTIPPEATNQGRSGKSGTGVNSGQNRSTQDNSIEIDDPSKDFRYQGFDDTDPAAGKTLGVNEEDTSARDKFLQKVIGPESGGSATVKNPRSSATGLYQFIKNTWKNTVAKAKPGDPHYGVSFEDMPKNIAAQHAAAKQIAKDYANTIKQFGLPDIPTSYYLLHGHGPTGIKIYQNPNSPLKDIYPEYIKNKQGVTIRNPVYTQNPNLNPNKPAMQIVQRMARDMGDKITDVFPSARASELPKDFSPTNKVKSALMPANKSETQPKKIEPEKFLGPSGPVTLTAAHIAKLPPVERFGHILPGLTFNKQGGIADVGKKPYVLPDGRTVTDPTILRDIYKIQQQELKKAKELSAKDDDSFLSKVGRVASGELASQVFSPKPPPPPTGSSAVPAKDSLSPGEKIIKPEELKTEPKRVIPDASKLKKELSDFEKAFAAARKEQGAKGEFTFQDPKTGKTGTYTTAYKNEKPESSVASNKKREADQTTNESLSINTELRDILRLAGRL